jgi:3-oxoacid CoA-transferase subunit A
MDYVTFYEIPYKSYNKDVLKVLTIPGAYSIDKFYRLQKGFSWFEQEQLSERERNRGLSLLTASNWTCDLVLSHTCPIMFEPTDLFLSVVDQSMVDKTMERYLGGIEYNLDYRAWCWGHYHQYRNYPRTDGRRRLMLFNDYAVELTDFMESEVPTKL